MADPPNGNEGDLTRQPFQVAPLEEPGIDDVQLARLRQLPSSAADWLGSIAKVLTSWNNLMLAAFAEAARALDRAEPCRGPITAKLLTLVETVAEHLTSKASCME